MAELTKEMIIDPTKITDEVRESLRSEMKGCNYAVIYLHESVDYGTRIVERYGYPVIESYNNGKIYYERIDGYETEKEAKEAAKIVKKISNKKFVNVSVIAL